MGKDIIPSDKGLLFRKTDRKDSNGAYIFSANCKKCGKELAVIKCRVKSHKGLCRSCNCSKMAQKQIKEKKAFKSKLDRKVFANNGKLWTLIEERDKNGKLFYKSDCKDCGKSIKCDPFKLKTHRGVCRSCMSAKKAEKKAKLEAKREQKLKDEAKRHTKTLGEMVIEFDNAPKSNVRTFNEIFGEIQGGNQDDEIIIGGLFTSNGRVLYREGKEIRYLHEPKIYGNLVYDVYDKNTGDFIWTYKTQDDIATDFSINKNTLQSNMYEDRCDIPIKVRSLCLWSNNDEN